MLGPDRYGSVRSKHFIYEASSRLAMLQILQSTKWIPLCCRVYIDPRAAPEKWLRDNKQETKSENLLLPALIQL